MYRWIRLAALSLAAANAATCANAGDEEIAATVEGRSEPTTDLRSFLLQAELAQWESEPLQFSQVYEAPSLADLLSDQSLVATTSMLQPTPFAVPRVAAAPSASTNQSSQALDEALYGDGAVSDSLFRSPTMGQKDFSKDVVSGAESLPNVSSDVGSLLGKSSSSLGTNVQKRTPIISDPRVRSSRIGSLAASGSHWVPARIDLDTVLSKIDSRQIADVVVIPGPYSSLYGPGFQFVDFQLQHAPRYASRQMHGESSMDVKSNGGQVFGQQTVLAGDTDWGMRATYAQRGGSDYRSGDGDQIAASYKSREAMLVYGEDLGDGRSIEFSALRLDQTDVEFPGYVFDIDFLVTDGYSVRYIDQHASFGDQQELDVWYNRTRLEGSSNSLAKQRLFPFLGLTSYQGRTDVDSMSTGYRQGWSWGTDPSAAKITVGHDLRFVKQELNEISTGTFPFQFAGINSPIPNSYAANPGLFTELVSPIEDGLYSRSGARLDYVRADLADDADLNAPVGIQQFPVSYAATVGTNQVARDFVLPSIYTSLNQDWNEATSTGLSIGFAERQPNLTELYAAQPFILMVQNGLNSITGDPTLKPEKLLQCDAVLDYQSDMFRTGLRGFHAWAFDYVTFENTNVNLDPFSGQVAQVSLRSVNTDLATLAGCEAFFELAPNERLTPFFNCRYVDGRDRTRNGNFATTEASNLAPSTKVQNLSRGFFSGILSAASEPLPGIIPFESRIGLRLRDDVQYTRWNMELSARVVDNQDRIATSLLETPTPGYSVYDLRGYYRPFKRRDITVVSGIENFTDKQYREHLDYRSLAGPSIFQPGINFYAGTDWRY